MGTLENEETRNENGPRRSSLNADLSDVATQKIDSQFSPGGILEGEKADEFPYPTSNMRVNDTYLLVDEFETQLANLDYETQAVDVDLFGETQVVDLAGETQDVDFAGETQDVDLAGETQVLDDLDGAVSKCEEANKTEALSETQELSQGDSVKTNGSDFVGMERTMNIYPTKQGSVFRGFTSIRAASIRASGLAASTRGANGNFSTTTCDKSSLEEQIYEQDGLCLDGETQVVNLADEHNEDNVELRNSNRYKVGNSKAVRKLFGDDKVAEVGQSDADVNHTDGNLNMPELLASEHCEAGLSYANSQEPGELSQAHALEVVEKFLDLNATEYDESFGMRVRNAEKPKVVSGAKGSRDLAKISNLKSTGGECGVYDWDDTREDDHGGDFFLKKKELFFDNGHQKQRSLTEPRKPILGSLEAVGNSRDKKEQKCTKSKLGDSVYSDSHLMLQNSKPKGKAPSRAEKVVHKNLMQDLDEQLCGPTLAEKEDANRDVPDIGPDTQMAAEAMETLCLEVHLADSDSNGPNKGSHCTKKGTRKIQSSNRTARSAQNLTPERPRPTSAGVVTRQAKQLKRTSISSGDEPSLPPKQSKRIRTRRDTVLQEAEKKGPADVNVLKNHGTESTGQMSEKKRHLEDQLDFSVPVAHRTRKCTELNRPKAAANSSDTRETINGLTSGRVIRNRKAVKDKNAEMVNTEEVGLSGSKPSNTTCVGIVSASNIDNLQGKISREDTLHIGQEANTRYSARLKGPRKNAASISLGPGRNKLYEKIDAETSADGVESSGGVKASSREGCGTSVSNCVTPATCTTPIKDASPICMGDEYRSQSCRKNLSRLSLITEIDNLVTGSPGLRSVTKGSRKRRDITDVRVLFSQHLDVDVTKQQKKILARLGGAVASSMSDATHFVADEFVRTRNMLEAIALGKPVITHLWLESCGQASCLIDEKNYILRDAKKEREFGFCLPVSISRACQHPLLQGQKVLFTPNTKPGKEILANLVKAVHGSPVERLGRSALKDEKLPEDLLILSCEEDYDTCVPFLEKGGTVYSSELLLNGIVKQKLEYERHRLFADHVKRTRSTIWVKKKNQYLPVTKCK